MFWNDLFPNLLFLAFFLLLIHLKNYLRAVYLALTLPGPPALPILGNVFLIRDNNKLVFLGTKMSELYGPIMKCWVSVLPFFFVYEPKHLQIILSNNKLSTKNMFYSFLHNFVGDGLITNTGEKWKQHRKLIQPYFHINVLKVFFEAFHTSSRNFIEDLNNKTDVNVIPFVNKFILDALQDAILGISAEANPKPSPYREGKVHVPYRLFRPWLLLDALFRWTKVAKNEEEHKDVLQNYTKSILEKKRKNMNENVPPSNLMEMLIEISRANLNFRDEDIVNEACTFMLAGQDSIAAALSFSLYFLAAHQEIQQKVLKEINSVLKNSSRQVTFQDVLEMKYLEQCIKETLRLCPSVPIISRKLTEDVVLGKHVLPQGTNIFISPFVTHRLPHIYPDPLKFDPDRFSPENQSKIQPYGFIPFSAGPRNCIGYKFALIELKTVLSEVLRTYHLSLTPGHEKINLLYRVTLKAKNGIWLRLKKRLPN